MHPLFIILWRFMHIYVKMAVFAWAMGKSAMLALLAIHGAFTKKRGLS